MMTVDHQETMAAAAIKICRSAPGSPYVAEDG
jgi:hypothetical protein